MAEDGREHLPVGGEHILVLRCLADHGLHLTLDGHQVEDIPAGDEFAVVGRVRNDGRLYMALFDFAVGEREKPIVVSSMALVVDVKVKDVILLDDIIDTGGTLVRGVSALMDKGAARVLACCTHGVFAGDAIARICDSPIEQVVTTNSIPLSPESQKCSKIKVLSVAKLLAGAIRSIHEETSVSKFFV